MTLRWEGGLWAHKYDIYFGTTNPPPLVAQNFMPGSATAGVSSNKESFNPCAPPAPFVSACPAGLAPGTTYYWKIRGKTMIGDGGGPFNAPARAISGPMWSFTTSGSAPSPAAPTNLVATPASQTRIDLAWTDVAGDSRLQDRAQARTASDTAWTQIGTTATDVVVYQDSNGLLQETAYNYRVRASTAGGTSAYSNTATALILSQSVEASRILADAYVRGGQYANANYGNAAELIAKFSADAVVPARSVHDAGYQRRSDRTSRPPAAVRQTLRYSGAERDDGHRAALDECVDRDDGELEHQARGRSGYVGDRGGFRHDCDSGTRSISRRKFRP